MIKEVKDITLRSIKLGDNFRVNENRNIAHLMNTMKLRGVMNPVTVRKEGRKYVLVAGFRRYLAAKKLGWTKITASIMYPELFKQKGAAILMNMDENTNRENPTLQEYGRAIAKLKRDGLTVDEVAAGLGLKECEVKALSTCFQETPKEFRSKVRRVPRGERPKNGEISNSTANALVNNLKTAKVAPAKRRALFKAAAEGKVFANTAKNVVTMVEKGFSVADAVGNSAGVTSYTKHFLFDKKKFERLVKKHGGKRKFGEYILYLLKKDRALRNALMD